MQKKKIQIVEDEGIVVMHIEENLKSLGYDVSGIASSGEKAIELAENTHPDLVLMDIVLKGEMDGIEAADQIRKNFDIPVIFLTAFGDENTLQRAKATEPFAYLLKPFKEKELHIAIEIALYKHEIEDRFKRMEQWLATVLRSIGDAVIATRSDGSITFMNSEAETLTGWKQEEALNRKLDEIYYLQERDAPILINKNGKEIYVEGNRSPITDEKGVTNGEVIVFRNITEQKQYEEVLKKKEEMLSKSQEIAHIGSWELDLITNKLAWSDEVYRIFGLEPQEFASTNEAFIDAVHPSDREAVNAAYNESLKMGRDGYDITHRVIRNKTGEVRYVREKCMNIKDPSGRIIRSVGIVHDITKAKQTEEELKKINEELDQRVKERTSELEKKNAELETMLKSFVGRELRMIELKEQIAKLEKDINNLKNKRKEFDDHQ